MIFQAAAMQKAGKIKGPLRKDQATVSRCSAELGGHCRTGLEDNVRMDRETLAPSNAAPVRRTVEICAEHGRRPATPAEARGILGL